MRAGTAAYSVGPPQPETFRRPARPPFDARRKPGGSASHLVGFYHPGRTVFPVCSDGASCRSLGTGDTPGGGRAEIYVDYQVKDCRGYVPGGEPWGRWRKCAGWPDTNRGTTTCPPRTSAEVACQRRWSTEAGRGRGS